MKPHKNALEWIVFGASAAIVVAVFAVLIVSGVQSRDEPPHLEIATGTPSKHGQAFRVPVSVRNDGDETAEQAKIEVVLLAGDRVVEQAELTVAYVPRHSRREGWVTFHNDPACCAIVSRAAGYNEP